jgi:Transcriptional regulator
LLKTIEHLIRLPFLIFHEGREKEIGSIFKANMESERRAQILNLAKKRFERFGFNKTTVDEIAKDAGISKRTLYQEFENKEKILEELLMFEALSVRKAILNQISKIHDPAEKLQTYIRLSNKYLEQNPFIVNVLNDAAASMPPFSRKNLTSLRQVSKRFSFPS